MRDHVGVTVQSRPMISKLAVWLCALPLAPVLGCAVEPATGHVSDDTANTPDVNASSGGTSRHCVTPSSEVTTCYGTFTEAIAAATSGVIRDAPADPKDIVDESLFADRINAISQRNTARGRQSDSAGPIANASNEVVIGIVYKDANYHGDTWVFTKSAGCDGLVHYGVGNLNTSPYTCCDFNDNISSFHSYSGCGTILYEHWFEMGVATNDEQYISDMDYVGGVMNDRASSISWH